MEQSEYKQKFARLRGLVSGQFDALLETMHHRRDADGVLFVKTSIGFNQSGATTADFGLMLRMVGPNLGVKASGGVRTQDDALAMVEAVDSRIGASAGIAIIIRQSELRRRKSNASEACKEVASKQHAM